MVETPQLGLMPCAVGQLLRFLNLTVIVLKLLAILTAFIPQCSEAQLSQETFFKTIRKIKQHWLLLSTHLLSSTSCRCLGALLQAWVLLRKQVGAGVSQELGHCPLRGLLSSVTPVAVT